MSYEIRLRPAAQKELNDLPEGDYQPLPKAISGLEENPRPPRVKKLSDSRLWRIRVGRCRVVYIIDDEARIIIVVSVARRQEDTYREL